MEEYDRYSKFLLRSVNHIFINFLEDSDIEEVYETQSTTKDNHIAVEIDGTIRGEIIINIPNKTLNLIAKKFVSSSKSRVTKQISHDVAGELANLITGTFANQLQYDDEELILSPPEINDDPIQIKALYNNVNLSFSSSFGGFDIDLYFRDMDY